jgi:hypothetical protein
MLSGQLHVKDVLPAGGQCTVSTIGKWVAGQVVEQTKLTLLEIEPNSSIPQTVTDDVGSQNIYNVTAK